MRRTQAFLAVTAWLFAAYLVRANAHRRPRRAACSSLRAAPRPRVPDSPAFQAACRRGIPLAAAPKGTGVVRGRVTAAGSTAPLRRAQVMLNAAELQLRRSTTTDAEGRYEFSELPAGRYSLNVDQGRLRRARVRAAAALRAGHARASSPTASRSPRSTWRCRAAASSPAASPTSSASRSRARRCRRCAMRTGPTASAGRSRPPAPRPTTSASSGCSA